MEVESQVEAARPADLNPWIKRSLVAVAVPLYIVGLKFVFDSYTCFDDLCDDKFPQGVLMLAAASYLFAYVAWAAKPPRRTPRRLWTIYAITAVMAVASAYAGVIMTVGWGFGGAPESWLVAGIVICTLAAWLVCFPWFASSWLALKEPPVGYGGSPLATLVGLITCAPYALPLLAWGVPEVRPPDESEAAHILAFVFFVVLLPTGRALRMAVNRFSAETVVGLCAVAVWDFMVYGWVWT